MRTFVGRLETDKTLGQVTKAALKRSPTDPGLAPVTIGEKNGVIVSLFTDHELLSERDVRNIKGYKGKTPKQLGMRPIKLKLKGSSVRREYYNALRVTASHLIV